MSVHLPVHQPVHTPVRTAVPVPAPPARRAPSSPLDAAPARRANRGDERTVDPEDRRRRARTALLELAVARSVERRRVI